MVKRQLSPLQSPAAKRSQPHQADQKPREYSIAASSTWYAIGQCAMTLELEHLALRAFESALRHTPDHIDSLASLCRTLRKSHTQQSVDVLVSAVTQFPHLNNEPLLWKELAESHLKLEQYEQAHQAVSRALTLRNNDPELLLIAARALDHLNPSHAQHTYHAVLSIITSQRTGPAEAEMARECHYKLGLIAYSEMNWKAATAELQAAISFALQCNAESEQLWCLLAGVRERALDVEGALQVCRDAIQVLGLQRKICIMTGYLALLPNKAQQMNPNYAISILSPVVMIDYNDDLDCLAWYLLGKVHSLNNNPRQAYDSFQCALKKGKSSPLPWLAVGGLYLKMGQLPDALAAYSQAANLLVEDGSMTSAIASAAAWDGLACVYERCDGQAVDAADAYIRAASCYRAADDMRAASQAEQRAHSLQAAARGEAPVPALRPVPETSPVLLRDMVMSLIQNDPKSKSPTSTPDAKQFHHLPLPKRSLVDTASVSPSEKTTTPQWRPQAMSLHVSPQQMPQQPVMQQPPQPPQPPQTQHHQPVPPPHPQAMPYPPPMAQHIPVQQHMPYYPPPGVVWR